MKTPVQVAIGAGVFIFIVNPHYNYIEENKISL
jgi:hypothetical protein